MASNVGNSARKSKEGRVVLVGVGFNLSDCSSQLQEGGANSSQGAN